MVKELWHILTSVASLTKGQERSDSDIKELRQEVNKLSLTTVKLVLENYNSEINYVKEGIAAKFDVLTTRLDLKMSDFERHLPRKPPISKTRKSLKKSPQG